MNTDIKYLTFLLVLLSWEDFRQYSLQWWIWQNMHKSCLSFSMSLVWQNLILQGLKQRSGTLQFGCISAVQLNFDLIQFSKNFVCCFLLFLIFHNLLLIKLASSVIPSKCKWIYPLDFANSNLPQQCFVPNTSCPIVFKKSFTCIWKNMIV